MELFADKTPKTAENFRALCTGEKCNAKESGFKLHYKETFIDRVVPNLMWCGGDITYGKGDGSESIYGGEFDYENFIVKHDGPCILSMYNTVQNDNGSDFMILMKEYDALDGVQVAFGKVVKGLDLMRSIEKEVGTESRKPFKRVVITNCGEITK